MQVMDLMLYMVHVCVSSSVVLVNLNQNLWVTKYWIFALKKASAFNRIVGKFANSQKLVFREPPLSHAWTGWEAPTSFVLTYLCIPNHPK